jgi:putative ABC transport system permease protein
VRAWRIAQLAIGGLRRAPLRVVLTTLGVAIASSAMVAMVAFALGLQRQVETPFRLLDLLKDIQVSSKKEDSKAGPVLDDAALNRMEQVRGVALVYPDIRIKGLKVTRGRETSSGVALAMPREVLMLGEVGDVLVAGRFFEERGKPEAVLGKQLVRDLGFETPQKAIGGKVTLEATGMSAAGGKNFTFQHKKIEVVVVGVLDIPPVMSRYAMHAVLLPMAVMREIPRMYDEATLALMRSGKNATGSYPGATVRVGQPSDLESVEKQIQAMGFRTRTLLSQFEEMRTFFVFLDVLLGSVGAVALLVAALGIVNTLVMSVLERYQEIGIYKALGASDGDLVVMFLTEAAIIGLLGGLGGLAIGWSTSWVLEIIVNYYAQGRGVSGHLALFTFPVWLLLATVLFSVVVSVLAGVYPALRAARIDTIRVLRRG